MIDEPAEFKGVQVKSDELKKFDSLEKLKEQEIFQKELKNL